MRVLAIDEQQEIVIDRDFRREIAAQIKTAAAGKELSAARMKKVKDDLSALQGAILNGFSADGRNNLYFTVAPLFTAFRAGANGLDAFGVPGGGARKIRRYCRDRRRRGRECFRLRPVAQRRPDFRP